VVADSWRLFGTLGFGFEIGCGFLADRFMFIGAIVILSVCCWTGTALYTYHPDLYCEFGLSQDEG